MPNFDVSIRPEGTLLALTGEFGMVDIGVLNTALSELAARPPQLVVIEMSKVTMLASCGIGALVAFRRAAIIGGGSVRLAGVNRLVAEAMRRAALQKLFEFHDSVDAAFGAPPPPAQSTLTAV